MVLEQFLQTHRIKKHALFIFVLSFFYVLIGYVVSVIFFDTAISIAILFTLSLLLAPSLAHILSIEEKIERKYRLHHFFHNHKDVFKVYFFCFLGLFAGFLLISY